MHNKGDLSIETVVIAIIVIAVIVVVLAISFGWFSSGQTQLAQLP